MEVKGIKRIEAEEVAKSRIAGNMPDRPSQQSLYGGRAMTSEEVKEAFDRLPRLIVEYYNALIESIGGVSEGELYEGSLASMILTAIRDGHTLKELFEEIKTGEFCGYLALDSDTTLEEFYEKASLLLSQKGSEVPSCETVGGVGAIYTKYIEGEGVVELYVCVGKNEGGYRWIRYGYADATEYTAGLLSSEDKSRLDSLWRAKSSSLSLTLGKNLWESLSQTVEASGVRADNTVIVSPSPEDYLAYIESEIVCTAQREGSLTFTAVSLPEGDIKVNVIVMGG